MLPSDHGVRKQERLGLKSIAHVDGKEGIKREKTTHVNMKRCGASAAGSFRARNQPTRMAGRVTLHRARYVALCHPE
jgi:hypothetical protein